jgi:hypothetical protein
MNRSLIRSMLCLVLLACHPIGPCPGGRLSGEVGPPGSPIEASVRRLETAQLETRPSAPHSVHTWFVAIGERLYVPTSMIRGPRDPRERSWVGHVETDPAVRIRLGDRVYERIARRVDDPEEYAQARAALEEKYALDPAARDPDRAVWIFRLDERGP